VNLGAADFTRLGVDDFDLSAAVDFRLQDRAAAAQHFSDAFEARWSSGVRDARRGAATLGATALPRAAGDRARGVLSNVDELPLPEGFTNVALFTSRRPLRGDGLSRVGDDLGERALAARS